jgi:cellulose synthase operon protein C
VTFTSTHPAPRRVTAVFVVGLIALSVLEPAGSYGQATAEREGSAGAAEPKAAADTLNFANGLLLQKHYARAAEEYGRFLKEVPTGPDAAEAHLGLAKARLFLNPPKYLEARRHFEEFRQMAPDHPYAPSALFRVGETSYLSRDPRELPAARAALEQFTASNPGHRDLESAWPYLGDVCFRMGDLPKARLAYEQSLVTAPLGRLADRARYGLAQTLAAQGEFDAALKIFTDLVDREALGWADLAQFQIGQAQTKAGRDAEAIAAFESLERAYPRSALVRESRLRRAEALARLSRYDEAETLLRPLVSDPSQDLAAQAAYALGNAQLERGRAAEARTTFDEALKRFAGMPLAPALWFRSGDAALKEGKANLARARYLKVAEVAPDDPWAADALIRAADLALKAREFAAAQGVAASLSSRYPNSPLVAQAHLLEARAAFAGGQAKAAISLLNGLLANDKPSAEIAQAARFDLGQAYRADGQADKANEILEALAKTPAAPVATDAQFSVGQMHFEAGRFAEAIPPLEKYLAGKPRGDVADHALAYLAVARMELDQGDAALTALEQLSSRFPKSKTLVPTELRLADAALTGRQYDRAADLFRRAAEAAANDPKLKARALSGVAWALLEDGKPAEAAASFSARLEAASDDALAPQDALARGRALEEIAKTDEALTAYAFVSERYAKSNQAGSADLARARLLAKTAHFDEAARVFSGYVQSHPQGGGEGEGLDSILAEWGWALLDAKKLDAADRVFARLLSDFPNSPKAADARLNLADSAYKVKSYNDVPRLLEPLVAAGSQADSFLVQSALYLMGRTCMARLDWPGAARIFERLVTEYPEGQFHREARFWKAEVAFQADDAKTAETEFAALLATTPAEGGVEAEAWIQTARLRRVQSLILLERWKDALGQADALKVDSPQHRQMAEIDYARGRALQGLAEFDAARAAFQAVIDTRKGGDLAARAQFMVGETYFHQKNYSQALRELLKVDVLYNAPTWQAAALLEAGKVYERLAQWTDAAEIYKKLRDKFPNDRNAAEASSRLDAVQKQADARKDQSGAAERGQ